MNIILFRIGDERFGLPAEAVSQVVAPPPVTPIPFVPPACEGLVNVGGRVLPQFDGAQCLGRAALPAGGEVLVVRGDDGPFALRVDRVLMMAAIDDQAIAAVSREAEDHQAIAAEFSWNGGMVLLLDPDSLCLAELALAQEAVDGVAGAIFGHGEVADAAAAGGGAAAPSRAYLLVAVGAESYALDLPEVREVVDGGELVALPGAPPVVRGLASLRGQPLLVLSLARLLGLGTAPAAETCGPLAVIAVGDIILGLEVSAIRGIHRAAAAEHGSLGDGQGAVGAYLVGDDGAIIAILEREQLIEPALLDTLRHFVPQNRAAQARAGAAANQMRRRLLSFWIDQELCALDLALVSRVAEHNGCDAMPGPAQADLAGVVESGSDVLPVVDLRQRLGLGRAPRGIQVVTRVQGHDCVVVVDRLHRIIEVAENDLRAAGTTNDGLIAQVGQCGDGLVSVLAADALLVEARP